MSSLLELAMGLGQTMWGEHRVHSFGQMTAEQHRVRGVGEDGQGYRVDQSMEPGQYHVGSRVLLQSLPNASSPVIATLEDGETVYVWGDMATDSEHAIDQANETIPNPDPALYAGIDYVHVGTETHGAGWVPIDFIAPGVGPSGKSVAAGPSSGPASSPARSSAMPIVVGVLVGVAALGAIALGVHYSKGA